MPNRRFFPEPYTERDVQDVESYVRHTVSGICPHIAPDDREQLVARGIVLVSRMARALPPEASLAAFLHDQLGGALSAYRWRRARRRTERPRATPTLAAQAAGAGSVDRARVS
jgi:hypothetical protein